LASWRKVHWSDESRFLLHVTYGRVRVWRQPNTANFRRFRTVLADSNRWGNHCLFKTVLLANRFRLTRLPRALSSLRDVIRNLPDRGRSITSLVNRCLLTIRLTIEWCRRKSRLVARDIW
jgi:hypothetical protein